MADIAGDRLRSFIERVEKLEEEKKEVSEQVKDVMSEAKSAGYDTSIIRQILRLRKLDDQKRNEQDELLTLYMNALGM